MELSNLRPAEGSKHSDNFRRGRGHGSGNGKTAGKGHKSSSLPDRKSSCRPGAFYYNIRLPYVYSGGAYGFHQPLTDPIITPFTKYFQCRTVV